MFLRVLHDALFAGPGAADLLLPRQRLSALLPVPATRLAARAGGAAACTRVRARAHCRARRAGWRVDGEPFDAS